MQFFHPEKVDLLLKATGICLPCLSIWSYVVIVFFKYSGMRENECKSLINYSGNADTII
jgi:hypothetical protein